MSIDMSSVLSLILAGGAIGALWKVPTHIWSVLQRRIFVNLDVVDTDPAFDWFTLWLDEHPYSKKARVLNVSTIGSGTNNSLRRYEEDALPRPHFAPGVGYHLFWFKRRPVWFVRWRADQGSMGSMSTASIARRLECFSFRILGRNPEVVRQLVEEAREVAERVRRRKVCAYITSYGAWYKVGDYKPRPMESVVLDRGVKEHLVRDVQGFLRARQWYEDMGIPFHRGYLLSGPPGTGKTSLVSALAGELKRNLYVMNIAGMGMTDERLAHLVTEMLPNSLLLMEDIDATTRNREERETDEKTFGVSLSGLLNVLDGVLSRDGCIVVMTSNYRERLDPAMLRPGRVDADVKLDYATDYQLEEMHKRFKPGLAAGKFIATLRSEFQDKVTPAIAQQRLMNLAGEAVAEAAGD